MHLDSILITEAVVQRCSVEEVFLEVSPNSLEWIIFVELFTITATNISKNTQRENDQSLQNKSY